LKNSGALSYANHAVIECYGTDIAMDSYDKTSDPPLIVVTGSYGRWIIMAHDQWSSMIYLLYQHYDFPYLELPGGKIETTIPKVYEDIILDQKDWNPACMLGLEGTEEQACSLRSIQSMLAMDNIRVCHHVFGNSGSAWHSINVPQNWELEHDPLGTRWNKRGWGRQYSCDRPNSMTWCSRVTHCLWKSLC